MAGLDDATKEPPTWDMEKIALYLQKLNSSGGQPKYPFLVSLFKALLSVSHGNSAPVNNFLIKSMLNVYGYSLGECIIEAFWFVKDVILQHSSILDILITRFLFEVVKDSRKWYMANLTLSKTLKERRKQRKRSYNQ